MDVHSGYLDDRYDLATVAQKDLNLTRRLNRLVLEEVFMLEKVARRRLFSVEYCPGESVSHVACSAERKRSLAIDPGPHAVNLMNRG
jgi:hypothetical protein